MTLTYLSLSCGAVATTVYLLWTLRWIEKRAWLLALLNGLISLAGLFIVYVFLDALTAPRAAALRFRQDLLPNTLILTLLLLPALARLIELRKDKLKEATTKQLTETFARQRS